MVHRLAVAALESPGGTSGDRLWMELAAAADGTGCRLPVELAGPSKWVDLQGAPSQPHCPYALGLRHWLQQEGGELELLYALDLPSDTSAWPLQLATVANALQIELKSESKLQTPHIIMLEAAG